MALIAGYRISARQCWSKPAQTTNKPCDGATPCAGTGCEAKEFSEVSTIAGHRLTSERHRHGRGCSSRETRPQASQMPYPAPSGVPLPGGPRGEKQELIVLTTHMPVRFGQLRPS